MFQCIGNCKKCEKKGRCANIYEANIEKEIIFPNNFKYDIKKGEYGIACDIGTTTIVMSLFSLETGEMLSQVCANNPQKKYGADVISRISYCIEADGNQKQLEKVLKSTIRQMINEAVKKANIDEADIKKVAFCGNTTMTLIFAGMSVDGIATYPFTPEYVSSIKLQDGLGYILPTISGHVGGDILAGIIALKETQGNYMLLDIGTNGEVVMRLEGKLFAFSTAAGPAFEGSNIECGMTGQAGAIERTEISDNDVKYKTINDKEPIGICGSGIISAVAQMKRFGIIDTDGKLAEKDIYKRMHPFSKVAENISGDKFFLAEKIYISQKDIRNLQLSKAAVRAGIELVLNKLGKNISDFGAIYIAGGFAKATPIEAFLDIGLIPKADPQKIHIAGNTALTGTSMTLLNDEIRESCEHLARTVKRFELTEFEEFQNEFLDAMRF